MPETPAAETPPPPTSSSGAAPARARRSIPESRKFWYAVIASSFPVAAQIALFCQGEGISITLVAMAMGPWMAMGGTEAWHDSIKLGRGE